MPIWFGMCAGSNYGISQATSFLRGGEYVCAYSLNFRVFVVFMLRYFTFKQESNDILLCNSCLLSGTWTFLRSSLASWNRTSPFYDKKKQNNNFYCAVIMSAKKVMFSGLFDWKLTDFLKVGWEAELEPGKNKGSTLYLDQIPIKGWIGVFVTCLMKIISMSQKQLYKNIIKFVLCIQTLFYFCLNYHRNSDLTVKVWYVCFNGCI